MPIKTVWRIALTMLALLLLTLAPTVTAQDEDTPITVIDALGNEVTIVDASRIITLGGAVTETVYALGLGDRIVAVDESSIYPEEAQDLPVVGYLRFLSAEPVLSVNPTLIITTEDAGPSETVGQLQAAGVTFLIVPAEDTVEGAIDKIRAIAVALGREARGEALISELEEDVALARELIASVETRPTVMFFFLRGRAVLTVSGEDTGAAQMLDLVNADNAVSGYTGYQPITAEAVIAAAPEIILTTSNGVDSIGGVDQVNDLPGVAQTPAGENGRVIASMDDLHLLGFTSRLGDAILELTYRVHPEIPRPVSAIARLDGDYEILTEALSETDLDAVLNEGGPYTLFAPVDSSLTGIELTDLTALETLLMAHVVAGEFSAESLITMAGESLTTLGGTELTITLDESGAVNINGVPVVEANLVASNGFVHGIADVLIID